MNFKNKKVAVLGWGINGIDVVKFLQKVEADISVFDEKENYNLDFSEVRSKNLKLFLGKDYLRGGLNGFDYIFRAPGVYRYLPEIVDAEKKGVSITSAIKLFFDLCHSEIIGVTGTKGKGTTSTLIYEILKSGNKDVYLTGNIGLPVLSLLPKLNENSLVVLELSSFQLIDLHKSPHISVILNITSDHMDWHKDRDEYIRAKSNIVKFQNEKDFAVINSDYPDSKNFESITKAKKYYFSKNNEVLGSFVSEGKIYLNLEDKRLLIGNTSDLLIRGEHNWENICASICSSYLEKVDIKIIKDVVFNFKGLEHRLELIRSVDGVSFYNDSFSTNPQTTIAAINSFSEPITLILGGSDKGLNYDELGKKICEKQNVKNVFLIGDIARIIKKSIDKFNFNGNLEELGKSDMTKIVKKSLESTKKGGLVLLSPGTASFDMFKSYKERGYKFKEAVNLL